MDGNSPTTAEPPTPPGPVARPALRPFRTATWPTWVAVLLCLLTTAVLWRNAVGDDREFDARLLAAERAKVGTWAQKRLDMVRWSLVASRGLFASSDRVERTEWLTYVRSLLDEHRMEWLTGLAWVQVVPRGDVAALESTQRDERAARGAYVREFAVWPDLDDPPPVARVVLFAEPERENGAALGFDAGTDREFRDALSRAAASPDVAMTGALRLPWDDGGSTSVGVVLRVPDDEPPEPGREARQEGWVLATVNLARLFSPSYGESRPHPEAEVQVLQADPAPGAPEGRTLAVILPWPSSRFGEAPATDATREALEFGGRRWEIEFRYPPGYDPGGGTGRPGLILALGLALTGLVAVMLSSMARTGLRAERLALRMTAALQASETAQRATLETVPDGLVVVDDAGQVRSFNPAAERLFGWDRAEIVGRDVRTLFAERSVHVGDSIFGWRERPLAEGTPAEITARRRDGREFTAEVHARDATIGGRRQVTALFRDVTERRRAEEDRRRHQVQVEEQRALSEAQAGRLTAQARELEQARDQADASARAKSEFLAAVSHEIRTPLNGILGMAHLLLESGLTGEQEECARTIRTSADALLAILNDILDVSKIEAGRIVLETVPFDLRAACDDVLDLMAPEAAIKKLELVQRFAPGTPHHLVGDPGRFRQVLLNLVHNAVKFTERGHVLVDVRALEAGTRDAVIEVRVEDTGIGIPREKVPALFRRFAQADSSTTRRYGGTGLGLLICRLLIERMGGTVAVESEPGTGSVFRFTMRLPRATGAPPEPGPDPDLAGRRLLLAAETELVRRVVREEAEALGCVVEEAGGPAAAVSALRASAAAGAPCAAAFLFPSAEGAEAAPFVRSVRADPALAGTALALVVDAPQQGGARAAEEAGFDAYLVRPVRHKDFRDAARVLLLRGPGERAPFVTRQTLSADRRAKAGLAPPGSEEAAGRTRRRVLLAEDNAVNQKVAARMLERLNCVVDVAANGREAVEMVDRFPYDLVFMDCQMPEMDGYQAAREIRRREAAGRRVPIIALTAHAMDEDRQRCLDVGMDEYVRKPVSPEDLSRTLLRWAPADDEPLPS